MGQSSSAEQASSPEQREVEALAASTGALPVLQKAFSAIADPQTKAIPLGSLKRCFELTYEIPTCETIKMPKEFPTLLNHLGHSLVDLFFIAEKGGLCWIEFLRGYTRCCGRTAASTSFNNLSRLYEATVVKAGLPAKLRFETDDDDCKMSGSLCPSDVLMLLSMCWVMSWDSQNLRSSEGKGNYCLPDINHLVQSAVLSCTDHDGDLDVWNGDISGLDIELPSRKFHMWALKTVPNLTDCLLQFIHARLRDFVAHEDKLESPCSSLNDVSSTTVCNTNLLTPGRAWALSLTLKGSMKEEILKACFPSDTDATNENILYRSSLHGRGLNRFWSNVDGYTGPILMLIGATSGNSNPDDKDTRKWIIAALTHQGFENKDVFYGTSGSLYAISPVFHVFASLGKEKNFVYSHLHPTGRLYDPHPKPIGIAFGGSIGNERIFMDEDFARVTVRHHVVDKTYHPGSIFPSQGYLPFEARVLEVEVWGLGGKTAMEIQTSYKKREELFTEQRRKVDMKTFASWEDSPEKMMMDMISDPNAVRREDR
ncbi:unnamed protein product [Ilex paraguariensis]|uniref:TLDc domain-containing protein n=1 Tax=Ilex paraguariensis TaxID=185542 RepID=A0ABC8UA81_9AQUA